jgi:hypothetical protein
MTADFWNIIKTAAAKRIIYTEHALDEMNREEEMITKDEVREVVRKGQIIEDYPEDKRGHSCLMFGYSSKQRPVHVVCSPKEEYLGVVTAYIPSAEKWEEDFKIRRRI